ncbi:MAG: small multi-drug export protein [Clostridiales bacterium]|nr:small multi-drug export protein [Clostridiales bacterium]MCF8023184.1 small multi-drug export protein [Clostridiales bacterium]
MIKKILAVVLLATTPWGEWFIAVPAGLLMNISFGVLVLAAFGGNLLPVLIICAFWSKLKNSLHKWQNKRQGKAQSFLKKYGITGLIFFAPMSVGVYVSTITALLTGLSSRRTILLHIFSLTFWGILIFILYLFGIEAWTIFEQ